MIWAIIILVILILMGGIGAVLYFLNLKRMQEEELKQNLLFVDKILREKNFFSFGHCVVSKRLFLFVDRNYSKMAIVKDFNPQRQENEIEIITVQLIKNIEKYSNSIRFSYIKTGELKSLLITPLSKEVEKFIYDVYKKTCFTKIQEKFPYSKFDLVSGSDLYLTYIWAYSKKEGIFAYSKTQDKYSIKSLNLLKDNVTLDIKYDYFETYVNGILQQLYVYEDDFLPKLFDEILASAKKKFVVVKQDRIYYDTYNNVLLLTNGETSLQIVALNRVLEVYFEEGKIKFELKNDDKIISFLADWEMINDVSEFIINKNLRRIAREFDYKLDKLINTTDNTKFIVDYSRRRIIYCANIETISRFNYVIYPFSSIENVKLEGKGSKSFVRIFTNENEILDISCNKYEVAEYIAALMKKLINEMYGL